MNFFPNDNMMMPNGMMMPNSMDFNYNLLNKFNEFENRLKKIEQRIARLENEFSINNDFNHNEPDNTFYMI